MAVPFEPGLKPAPDALLPPLRIAPNKSSFAWAVAAVVPLDGEALVPKLDAVSSRGVPARPVTEKTSMSCVQGALPPDQVTVTVAPELSCEARP